MNERTALTVPLVLLLLAPLGAAQIGTKGRHETTKRPVAAATTKTQTKTKDKEVATPAPTTSETKVRLDLHVKGLTSDNMEKARAGLSSLIYSAYVCDHCQVERSEAGKCPQCNAELKPEKRPIFTSVMPNAGDSTIAVVLAPNHVTRLSDIERALRVDAVTLDEPALPIAGQAELVLRGGRSDCLPALEKALQDAKLFDELHARWDASHDEIRVSARAGAIPPTRGRVESAIESLKLEIRDVVWGQAPVKA